MLSWGNQPQRTSSIDFPNNRTGFNQLVKWARKEAEKGQPILFLMEPTGTYYEDLAHHLNKIKLKVYVISASRVKAFFKEEGIKTKTDAVDAYGLALMGCSKPHLPEWKPPCPAYRELRQLTRLNVHFTNMQTMTTNYLEALSHQFMPSSEVMAQVKESIRHLGKAIARTEETIASLVEKTPEIKEKVHYIESIKGIGFLTAVTILAETCGFANISSRRQLASFAGLDIVARDSGTSMPARHISKVGNTYLRRILYMCALAASSCNPQMKNLYARISERRPKKVACVAIMRKLLLLAFTLCKTKQFYDSERVS